MSSNDKSRDHKRKSKRDENVFEWSTILNGAVAEFIGSVILTFITLVSYQTIYLSSQSRPLSATALAIGFGHFITTYTFMGTSSGFFNPLSTLPVIVSWVYLRLFDKQKAVATICLYIFAQCVGALVGGLGIYLLLGSGNLGTPIAQPGLDPWRVWYMEVLVIMVYTAMYMSQCLRKKRGMESCFEVALTRSIGAVTLLFISLNITGGILDPLHWFVPALFSTQWSTCWIWITGPLTGTILGCIIFGIMMVMYDGTERSLWYIQRRYIKSQPSINSDNGTQ